ncbi:MAG: hypothetical protein LBU60_05300 [Clostridiales bacterium]|jgi:hypothetical protein|nr:hypothetical protein [Clostridiales bacterium]
MKAKTKKPKIKSASKKESAKKTSATKQPKVKAPKVKAPKVRTQSEKNTSQFLIWFSSDKNSKATKTFIVFTVVFYVLIFYVSEENYLTKQHDNSLVGIVVVCFIIVAIVSTLFCIFENTTKNNASKLLTEESKIYYTDAILLSICDLIFCIVFANNDVSALFLVSIISCIHVYIIIGYFKGRFIASNNDSNLTLIKKDINSKFASFIATALLFSVIVISAVYLMEKAIFQNNLAYLYCSYYLIICIAIKEFYLENYKLQKKPTQ